MPSYWRQLFLPCAAFLSLTVCGMAEEPWAFRPLANVEAPADPEGWSANPIDRFIRAKQRERNLHPTAAADKRTMIRRVTFDLTGLPPTPEEVDAFLAD
jgi:hypothetical protein